MLEISNLKYQIGSFSLGPISLELKKGAYLAIYGPSGSGKSIFLELICGLRSPSEGSIYVNNVNYTHYPAHKRPIGLLFQDYALFPHMTVFENIAYSLRIRNIDKSIVKQKVNELAEGFSIQKLLNRSTCLLSGGEKQRVALARAIAYEPLILLLDEPLSALDEGLRLEAIEVLKDLKKRDLTIIHVTHNKSEVENLSTDFMYFPVEIPIVNIKE